VIVLGPIDEALRNRVVARVRSRSNHWSIVPEGTILAEPIEFGGQRYQVLLTNRNTAYVLDADHPEVRIQCTPYQSAAMRGLTR
jgi:hypothetical protein